MQMDVFMMFDCLRRCIKERTPLPYINVGAMNRVNPPLIFVSFNNFFPFFLIALSEKLNYNRGVGAVMMAMM